MQTHALLPAARYSVGSLSPKGLFIADQDPASGMDVTGLENTQFYSMLLNYLGYVEQNAAMSHRRPRETLLVRLTHFTSTSFVLGPALCASNSPGRSIHYYLYFTDEEIEVQRKCVACPQSQQAQLQTYVSP